MILIWFWFRMDGLLPHVAEKTYSSPPEQNLFTPPHSGRDGTVEITSSERRQYNKALKAMYEIVRLGSKRLEQPVAEDDDDIIPETVTETSETEDDVDGLYFYMSNSIHTDICS